MKKVLVAPLDWGLGHASRCIPLINILLQRNVTVVIAGSGRSLELLRGEFPSLRFFNLVGYDPRYPTKGSMVLKMATQLPHFLSTIKKEHLQLERIVEDEQVDIVISDNRFGCWSAKATSVFITHQSNILMPKRFGWLQGIVRRMNYRAMKKYDVCWIPDFPGEHSLAGELGQPTGTDVGVRSTHIGILSRFSALVNQHAARTTAARYDLLCIFSGPEPQRTILENLVVAQLTPLRIKAAIVRGVPKGESKRKINVNGDVIDFASTQQLWQLISMSEMVLARSGFSTVMDLAVLKKKAIFVPTPGQTEQEYLAAMLTTRQIAYSVSQKSFNLEAAMKAAVTYKGFDGLPTNHNLLHQAIEDIFKDEKVHE